MHLRTSIRFLTAAFGLLVAADACAAETDLQERIADLQLRNKVLEQGIAEANRAEKEASEQLAKVRLRLEALGRDLLDGGDDRLIQAAADLQILQERVDQLEQSGMNLTSATGEFIREAVASDPESRLRVETAMRELDELLGLRQKPAPAARNTGTSGRATVLSIDSESGLLVFNTGERQGTRIGTTYRLFRGEQNYGSAIIVDIRPSISGAFVETLEPGQGPVRIGDTAILEVQ